MSWRFKVRGSDGRVAIYEPGSPGSEDDVFDDPSVDYSRVLFHTAIDYPKVVAVLTGTLFLPTFTTPLGTAPTIHTIAAHGLSGIPLVVGRAIGAGPSGEDLPLCGSANLQGSNDLGRYQRWVACGADATHVRVMEQLIGFVPTPPTSPAPPDTSMDYEILVMTPLLEV